MRNIVYSLVKEALGEEFEDKVFASGAVDGDHVPPGVFVVIRFGTFLPGMSEVKVGSCDVWAHVRGADYDPIDKALQSVYGIMDGAEHVSEEDGSAELIQASWTATSGDLFDPGFRTLTKNSSYRLTGTGA